MTFQYKLTYNESEDRFEEGTANFKFPMNENGVIEVNTFEDVVEELREKFNHLTNANEYDWSCDNDGLSGTFRFQNSEDGLAVVFDIEAI